MSMNAMLRESVIVYNRTDGAADVFGNAADTFDVGTASPAWVQQQTVSEEITDRDVRISFFKVVLPADAPIYFDSEIEWNDLRMRVDGKPQEFYNHHGIHHIEVLAQLVEGS